MNYQQARIFIISTVIVLVLLITGLIFRAATGKNLTDEVQSEATADPKRIDGTSVADAPGPAPSIVSLNISKRVGNLARQFADLNEQHLACARRIGIEPIGHTRDIMRLARPIVRVSGCDRYHIDNLKHSYPYLVPQAAELLDTIGARFNRKLADRGGGNYKIKVTSLLRTRESVGRLKHGNVNSTENSAHLFATTFDISYVDFHEGMFNTTRHSDGELKNLLAEVLLELKEQGKCLVKFERKQGCFHITATGV